MMKWLSTLKWRELLGRDIFGTKETEQPSLVGVPSLPLELPRRVPLPAGIPHTRTRTRRDPGAGGQNGAGVGNTMGNDSRPLRDKKEGEPQLRDSPFVFW
jgi:hypothetical protein